MEVEVEKKDKGLIKGSWFEEGKAFDMNARETDHKLDQDRKLE